MSRSLASKQLNILHAEDDKNVFESCKRSILETFDNTALPKPIIENVVYCNSIIRKIIECQTENKVYDVLLLDIELLDKSEYNGVNAIDTIKEVSPHTKIFVLSGNIYDRLYHAKLQEYKEKGKIVNFFETGNHEKWCKELINIVKMRDIGILHFSDMHICMNDNSEQILTGFAKSFEKKSRYPDI